MKASEIRENAIKRTLPVCDPCANRDRFNPPILTSDTEKSLTWTLIRAVTLFKEIKDLLDTITDEDVNPGRQIFADTWKSTLELSNDIDLFLTDWDHGE